MEIAGYWYRLVSVKVIRGSEKWRQELCKLNSHLLVVGVQGQFRCTINGRMSLLEQGNLLLVNEGCMWEAEGQLDESVRVFLFAFQAGQSGQAERTEDQIGLITESVVEKISTSSMPGISDLCEGIARQWEELHSLEQFRSQAMFHELLYRMCKARGDAESSMSALDRIEAYMRQHYNESITVEKLAAVAGLSERHLMRQFKEAHGCSIMAYVNGLRIREAKRLLTGSVRKMTEVAEQVGYKDEYYFTRKFKQQVGIPPAAYMKNRQRKIAAYSWFNLGHLLPLQIVPEIAPLDHWWTDHYRSKYASDVNILLSHSYGENLRILAQSEPDAIVALNTMDLAEQGRMQQVAQTIFVPWMEMDWRGHLEVTAYHLGKEQEAELWLRTYDNKARLASEQVRRLLGDETVLVARPVDGGCEIFGGRNAGAVLYGDLGLAPAGEADRIPVVHTIGYDELANYDPDRLVLITNSTPRARASLEALQQAEVWSELRASAERKVYVVGEDPWTEYTAYGHNRLIDAALDLFGGNVQRKTAVQSIGENSLMTYNGDHR